MDEISENAYEKFLDKINRLLTTFKPDLPQMHLFIRKNDDKYHPKRKHRHTSKDYTAKKTGLAHFEGVIDLVLPRKRLDVRFKGATVKECIHLGSRLLVKEIKQYKELHFKSQSQYPSQKTIRRTGAYGA
jgi:hypothetical protein